MRSFVSAENCAAHYGVEVNCTVVMSPDNSTALFLGDAAPGKFEGDPDIAGAGVSGTICVVFSLRMPLTQTQVLGAFLCVTAVALLLAIVNSMWWVTKNIFNSVKRLSPK